MSIPQTRHSVLIAVKDNKAAVREQALGALIDAYWKPVYKYIRYKWSASSEDAKDLTQEFFAIALEKSFFKPYDPAKGRFRTYLRTCVDGVVMNARKASSRVKRGGHAEILSLDFGTADAEWTRTLASKNAGPEEYFEQEWTRSLFALAVDDLRRQCEIAGKSVHLALFERYDLDPPPDGRPSYSELAAEFGISTTQVTNYLSFTRSEFRRHVLDRLGRFTGSDEEFRSEARRILGIDVP